MENHDKSDNSGNGFLIGIILGSVVTLLFTTKKGREIVKDLTEKGLERLSELQNNIDKAIIVEEAEENDYLEPEDRLVQPNEPEKPKLLAKESTPNVDARIEKPRTEKATQAQKPERVVKRLFRMKKN